MNSKVIDDLKNTHVGSKLWYNSKRYRITGTNARRAISMSDNILKYIDSEPLATGEYENDFYETSIKLIFYKFIKQTGIWIDPELGWLSCTPDGLYNYRGEIIPVEVKCKVSTKSFKDYIKDQYFQIQTQISVLKANFCLLIIIQKKLEKVDFFIVQRKESYEEVYLPRIEFTWLKYVFFDTEFIKPELFRDKIMKRKKFQDKFVKRSLNIQLGLRGCKGRFKRAGLSTGNKRLFKER